MTQGKNVQAALARLEKIDWAQADAGARRGSQLALVREFLHRMALWANALEVPEEWPFFSVAERMATLANGTEWAWRFADLPEFEDLQNQVPRTTFLQSRICAYYVQWSAICDTFYARKFDIPDPYEPAILTCERGGVVYRESGLIHVGGPATPVGSFKSRLEQPPLESLEPDFLAQRDAAYIESRRNQ